VTSVLGHSNRNNSAEDCSIVLKFAMQFHYVTGDTSGNVQCQKSKVKVTGSRDLIRGKGRHCLPKYFWLCLYCWNAKKIRSVCSQENYRNCCHL